MIRVIRHNLAYKILALVLSIALWADVKLHQEPLTKPIQARLEVKGLQPDLVATTGVSQVTAVVYGPKVYAGRLPSDSVHAYIDFRNAALPGQRKEEVKVVLPPSLAGLVSVLSIAPDHVDVKIRRISRKTIPVTISWTGKSTPGTRYDVRGVSPGSVVVSGPDEAVNDVDRAMVALPNGDQQVTGQYAVSAVDRNGDTVSEVEMAPAWVTVEATQRPTNTPRQVFVSPAYVGKPARGYTLDGVVTDPQMVTLIGAPELLQGVKSIPTRRLSIANSRSDISRTVEIVVPDGVTAQPASVQIHIRIRPKQ
ncbi:MAG TPA: CdaR family protein [Armatimonadota bacterium]|jgi:YbbR domain-containing protein